MISDFLFCDIGMSDYIFDSKKKGVILRIS